MSPLNVEEAQLRLPQLIDALSPGEEIVITRGDQVVARLIAAHPPKGVPVYGRGKGKFWLDVDDKSHLEHFSE